MERPDWVDGGLYPFTDHWVEIDGCNVHYVDEGEGSTLLMLHGNPTWSFTWRDVIKGVKDRYRCIALDYPGFGLSTAPLGYGFTPKEHADIVEKFVKTLDLEGITMLGHDWGGPIGFGTAARLPDRFHGFVIGNTWAWPMKDNRGARIFSSVLGGPVGGYLIKRRNFFVERIIPAGTKQVGPDERVMEHYRRPFPTPESRVPMHVFPREIIGSTPWLAEVERGLTAVDDRHALILWPTRDQAFGETELKRWESVFFDHRTEILHGAGHYIGEDAPQAMIAALRERRRVPR